MELRPQPFLAKRFRRRLKVPSVSTVVWALVTVGVLASIAVHEWSARKQEAEERAAADLRLQNTRNAINATVAATSAVADWSAAICGQGDKSKIYTSDLQDILIRKDGRPLLISGELADIRQENGEYVIVVSSYLCRDAALRVEAIADSGQVAKILSHRAETPADVAIVVRVTSVQQLRVSPAAQSSDGLNDETPSGEFAVRGHCVQVLFTGWEGFRLDIESRLNARHSDTAN